MSNQAPSNDVRPEPLSRHETRHLRREARHEARGIGNHGFTWVAGVLLILLGIAYLMQNMGILSISLTNWWALFILIPALGSFSSALRMYQQADNQLTASAISSLLVGVALTIVTVAFLFNIDWVILGPALIILVGIGLVITTLYPDGKKQE